jgi:hypothetical protein
MVILESMIKTTIEEFEKFIRFNEDEKPVLSAKLGVFGKKDSYKLNQILRHKKDVSGPNYNQDQYPVIDLMFSLALEGRLYVKVNDEKGKPSLLETDSVESFKALNIYEKYLYLLQTYWTKYDFETKNDKWIDIITIYNFLATVSNAEKGEKIIKNEYDQTRALYSSAADFLYHMRFFGFGELEEIQGAKGKYENRIKAFIPNEFGIEASDFLINRVFVLRNNNDLPIKLSPSSVKKKAGSTKNAFDVFKKLFPDGCAVKTVVSENEFDRSGVYTFKVSLGRYCSRKINVSHHHTLSNLHTAIQEAFNFDDDHLYAFYVNGNYRTGKPIYCAETRDFGRTTEETTIEEMNLYKGQKLYYLFDFGDMWEFTIELTKIDKNAPLPLRPVIIEEKGESPEQYPSWE